MEGRIKFYDNVRGYGFIERSGEPDMFFHVRDLIGDDVLLSLTPGAEVQFEVGRHRGRPCAVGVEVY